MSVTRDKKGRFVKGGESFNKGRKFSDEFKKNISEGHKGIKPSAETRKRMSLSQKRIGNKPPTLYGKDSPLWKGDLVKYRALHLWVERKLGKPYKCEHCKKENLPKRCYQRANKDHKYKKLVEDWIRLCAKCHSKHDRLIPNSPVDH